MPVIKSVCEQLKPLTVKSTVDNVNPVYTSGHTNSVNNSRSSNLNAHSDLKVSSEEDNR